MNYRSWMLFATALCMLSMAQPAAAQQQMVANNGKTVKRITFDQERVSVVYTDGTTETDVPSMRLKLKDSQSTGIASTDNRRGAATTNRAYDLQGRTLKANQQGKGVAVRKGKKVLNKK